MALNDAQLLRYSRHVLLPEVGIEGQERIAAARVLVVGAGGLGCPAALYLGAAGVGHLVIADGDVVELTNLQRQIGHDYACIGVNKARSLAQSVAAINPDINVVAIETRLDGEALQSAIGAADIVLDASDNFATRYAVNRACFAAGVPLVSGSALGFSGQLAVFDPGQPHSPCYHCLFPEHDEAAPTCSEAGVFAPLVGIIGAAQAMEALKYLAAAGEGLSGRLLLWDGWTSAVRVLKLPRDSACPVCATR
jgi:molybdopterin/thiamine biosynthesis adenylyltransferase